MKLINSLFLVLSFTCTLYSIDLLVKIPTRSRPKQFFKLLDIYYEKLSDDVDCAFLITCDVDDLSMNNDAVRQKLNSYPYLYYYFSQNESKIEAYNKDIEKHLDFKVLLVASDDMEPKIKGYDKIIMNHMQETFPDFDGVLNFSDGHYKTDYLNTMPVIGKKFYDRFGYIYYPGYISFCCDNELTMISRRLGKEKIIDQVIILHNHPIWNLGAYDQLYRRNQVYYEQDNILYKKRKQCNFYIN